MMKWTFTSYMARHWIRLFRDYRHLTGKTPMLPKWAFGYVQSKERYKPKEAIGSSGRI